MSKILVGTVVSNKMLNTIVVDVEKRFQHPRYRKIITTHKKYKVHVEDGTVAVGEVVSIEETRPISKDKHFILIDKKNKKTVQTEKKTVKKAVVKEVAPKQEEAQAAVEVKAAPKVKKVVKTTKKATRKTTKKSE